MGDEEPTSPRMLPPPVGAAVETALSLAGGVAQQATSQVQARSHDVAGGSRPWTEVFDLSMFGMASGGTDEYLARFKANFRYFFFNYLLLSLVLAGLSEMTKPLPFIGCAVILFVYFKLYGGDAKEEAANNNGEVYFLGMMLDERERAGLVLIVGSIIFLLVSSGKELMLRVAFGTLLVSVVHGCLRRPSASGTSTTAVDAV